MSQENTTSKKVNLRYLFTHILWPRKWLLLVGLIFILINRGAGLVLPGASKFLLDDAIPDKNYSLLWSLVIIVIVATFVQALTSFLLTKKLSIQAHAFIATLRSRLHTHIIGMPMSFFNKHKTGELASRIMNDVEGVRNLIGTGFVQLIGGVLTGLASLIILILIEPWLTVFAVAFMVGLGLVVTFALKRMRPIFRERNQYQASLIGRLHEALGGIKVIKGFSAEKREVKLFDRAVNTLFDYVKKTLTTQAFIAMTSVLIIGGISAFIMAIGGYRMISGHMSTGDFIAYTLYIGFLTLPVIQMSNIGSQITEAFAGLEHMETLLAMSTEEEDNRSKPSLRRFEGSLRFEKISFSYMSKHPVLRDISFDLPAHKTIAMVGVSGAGKTTLLNIAAGFIQPTKGTLFVDDTPLSKWNIASYRQHLSVVLQDDFLFDGTIKENILYSKPSATKGALDKAIKDAYVNEFTDRLPDGLNTVIGERGLKLSGGQKQRLSLARAFLKVPKLLLLDEATSNLDNQSERYIQQSLKKLMKTCTVLVIAHRLSTIQKADQILVMQDGSIVETGRHQTLMRKKGMYYKLYTYQARI